MPAMRVQVAALIVRAFGWDTTSPNSPAPFGHLGGVARNSCAIAIAVQRGIAQSFGDGTFGSTGVVTHAQAISFVTRAMVQAGFRTAVTHDDPRVYPNVSLSSGHRLHLPTYVAPAGVLPDRPVGAD